MVPVLLARPETTGYPTRSPEMDVTSGVPQDSILGPILFLLYVNDLPDVVVNSKVASFADDTKLYRRVDSTKDAILLQNDLDKLEAGSISSGLVFNQKKCKQQHITKKFNPVEFQYKINDKPLEVTNHEKDLGVYVSSDLTWKKHTLEQCTKANKLLGFIRRCAMDVQSSSTRRTLYLSHRTSCSWLRHSSVVSANNRPHKMHRTRPATCLKVYFRSTLPM